MSLKRATELIANLSESRSVEVKRWIDPSSIHGKAKIIKGIYALRNYNGGDLVIGFDDESLAPDLENAPEDVRISFHADIIQQIVSHFASEPFDVSVLFPEVAGQVFPVINVPAGVRIPVATKRELIDRKKTVIGCNEVYFRTLNTNNCVSSAKIPYKDWPELMRICFDNQEADVGRFIRRHLGDVNSELAGFLFSNANAFPIPKEHKHQLSTLLDDGFERYQSLLAQRDIDRIPKHGSFEVALLTNGDVPEHKANTDFLRLLEVNNPRLTGWPVWLNSQGFSDATSRPFVYHNGWEALLVDIDEDWGRHIEFMRKDPNGKFYLRRALQDDLSQSSRAPTSNTELDFGISIIRVAEAIAVGLSFISAMGCDQENTKLEFAFRWRGLSGRKLTSWVKPSRSLSYPRTTVQDEITCFSTVPLEAPWNTIHVYTQAIINELFNLFEGFEISPSVTENLVNELLERRM